MKVFLSPELVIFKNKSIKGVGIAFKDTIITPDYNYIHLNNVEFGIMPSRLDWNDVVYLNKVIQNEMSDETFDIYFKGIINSDLTQKCLTERDEPKSIDLNTPIGSLSVDVEKKDEVGYSAAYISFCPKGNDENVDLASVKVKDDTIELKSFFDLSNYNPDSEVIVDWNILKNIFEL